MIPSVEATPLSGTDDAEFVRMPLAAFRMPMMAGFDVFCAQEGRTRPTLLSSSTIGISSDDLDLLEARGYETLLVRHADFYAASEALFKSLGSIVANRRLATRERFAMLQTAVAAEIEGAFRLTESERFVGLAKGVGGQIAELLDGEAIAPADLYSLVNHDSSTFVHVTNVAGYAVVLAQQLWKDISREDLKQIAAGAMLHDFGKKFIPQAILTKPGRLSPGEREIIEKHPQLGYESLCRGHGLNCAQLMMAYQHHERIDGTGYPVRVLGEEIHPWAQLLAVVDVFDAMTGLRPYRDRAAADDALLYLAESAGTHFDLQTVLCWISIFHQR